jgi:CBS domain-containing protein
MDCVYASGGADGWRSIFNQAMDCDDLTDTASVHSNLAGSSIKGSIRSSRNSGKIAHPVSKLRPKAPNVCTTDDSVLSVAQMLASKRGDAAIITNSTGELAGIMTDTDVTRRLVAKKLPASTTCITDVMTANPSCVSMSDPATDALVTMVENHFRHLPVTDDSGAVVGVLDIAKCLNDAITQLERSNKKSASAAEEALSASLGGAGGAQAAALRQLLGPLLSQALSGQTSPTLRTVLAGKPSTIVSPSTTIQDTGNKMAEARKAALVVENGQLVGIFGFKDMMTRAVAKELPLEYTAVSTVMTPNPESVSPDTTVLEALQIMHENKFLTLPVCESNGSVIGVVDVMDCVYASGGADGWRSIFNQAMDCDDLTDTASVQRNKTVLDQDDFSFDGNRMRSAMATSHPNNIPLQVHVGGGDQESTGESWTQINAANIVVYKVVDDEGHTYVIRAGRTIDSVTKALEGKVSNFDPSNTVFKYFDDEGDEVLIKSDECVEEAVSSSILAGNKNVKLSMKAVCGSSKNKSLMLAGGAGLAAAVAFTVLVLLKPKKT